MLNTGTAGGAAVAAHRLHYGLLALGVDSRLWNQPYSPQLLLFEILSLLGLGIMASDMAKL